MRISHFGGRDILTLWLLELLHEEGVRVIWLVHDQLSQETLKELEDLLLFEVALNVLLVFKFLNLVHFSK